MCQLFDTNGLFCAVIEGLVEQINTKELIKTITMIWFLRIILYFCKDL